MKLIITGTTGYVGEGVMLACLDNPEIEKVLSVSRRPCGHTHPKLEEYIVPDFMALQAGDPKLQGYDAVFFIAGISSVGLKEEQYKGISHDIPLHFADVVGPKEKMTFVYLSGAGNYKSKTLMWVRVKKSTEDALVAMPFRERITSARRSCGDTRARSASRRCSTSSGPCTRSSSSSACGTG